MGIEFVMIWQYWAILALLFIVIEVFTTSFAFLSFTFGALGSSLFSFFEFSFDMQLLVFCILTILSFIFVRPIVLRLTQREGEVKKSNAQALLGRKGVVEDDFTELGGRVVLDGDSWKAISDDRHIKKGDIVEIVEINSIILTVRKKE